MPDDRPAYVYMLGTCDAGPRRTYVGWTFDVEARLQAHNSGRGAKSTKGRTWRVLHQESHDGKSEAMSAEWYLKKDRARRKRIRDQSA